MSLTKEIKALFKAEEGMAKVNDISYLKRWTKNALDDACDCLELRFDYLSGVKGGASYRINSRTYEGVMAEIEEATRDYFTSCMNKTLRNLKAGYRG
jgi:3-dehydroquinate dehydratase